MMSRVQFMFVTLFLGCGVWCHSGYASTVNAASCSQANVQTAINSTSNGDTAAIPAGNCTWTTAVTISNSITLEGAGAGSTNITINNSGGTGIQLGASNTSLRITGITLLEQAVSGSGMINIAGGTGISLRFDHNAFTAAGSYTRAIWMNMPCVSPGCVIDHNTFTDVGYIDKNVAPGDAHLGDASWTLPMSFGTINALYFEDNTFNFTADRDMDCAEGGRVVLRHNTITGTSVGNHGYDSVDNGCVEMDVYSNTLNGNGTAFIGLQSRGGTGVWYDNLIQGTYSGMRMGITNYRSQGGYNAGTHDLCNGSGVEDQNSSPSGTYHGWHCYEQIGMGTPATSFASYPLYEWDNCITALGCTAGGSDQVTATVYDSYGGSPDYLATHVQANRDYYDQVASFSGAAGIGRGALASRPSTCTAGVAYWGTDTNVLYQCSPTNTWTAYYTPYTYPHPLQGGTGGGGGGGGVAPPSGLAASVR